MKVTIKADSKTGKAKIKYGKKTKWLSGVSFRMTDTAVEDTKSNGNFHRITQVPSAHLTVFISGIVEWEATPDNVIPFPRKVA